MSFHDFLAEKYPDQIGTESDEPISCPSIKDFLDYIKDTNVPDISGIDFPEDQKVVLENYIFASFRAENANYNGGVTLKSVTVIGDISFRGSWIKETFHLQKIKCTNLVLPENVIESVVAISNITITGEVNLPEHA